MTRTIDSPPSLLKRGAFCIERKRHVSEWWLSKRKCWTAARFRGSIVVHWFHSLSTLLTKCRKNSCRLLRETRGFLTGDEGGEVLECSWEGQFVLLVIIMLQMFCKGKFLNLKNRERLKIDHIVCDIVFRRDFMFN